LEGNILRSGDDSDSTKAFDDAVAHFRVALAAGRSTVFLRLFDFLVERSHDDRSPKEVEIALAVFDDDGVGEKTVDSSVRVYVHRLRKRLDEFYSRKPGPRLMIPKGEYRIVLSSGPDAETRQSAWSWLPRLQWPRPAFMAAILAVTIAAGLATWALLPREQTDARTHALRTSTFWRSIGNDTPPLIVVGDSFMLAETRDQKEIQRMILDPKIRSRDDLGEHLKTHPEDFYRLYDLDLHFAPSGTAIATWDVQDVVASLGASAANARVVTSSKLDAEALATSNIVYVGRLSSLGAVAAPLFRTSQLRPGRAYNELIDKQSGQRHVADPEPGKDRKPYIDYGYIGRFPGPSGNWILVIGGIGDAAVQSMTALVSNPADLRAVEAKTGSAAKFEALFEVGAIEDIVMDRRLILARPLN
jgi:hypothetical protein